MINSESIDFEKSLKEITKNIRNIVTHDYLVVIISDFYRYSEEVSKHISYLSKHNDVLLAKVYDPMEYEPEAVKMIGGDGREQIVIDGGSKQVRNKFKEGFEKDFVNFESQMKKNKIPVLKFNTIVPIDTQLKELLKKKRAK